MASWNVLIYNGLEGAKELWLMVDLTFDSIVDSQRIQLDDEDVLYLDIVDMMLI